MTDVFTLTTSAAWRKLGRICADNSQYQQVSGRLSVQQHAVNYLSLAPYSPADASHHLAEVANEDAIAACSLSLYRACLLFAYKHIINTDFQRANAECHHAIAFLREGLARLKMATWCDQYDLTARTCSFVNCLASQAELQQARTTNKLAPHLVFVLGMHRSGTSALTGMLAQAGLTAPSDLMPATIANPKGYWESLSIVKLNEDFITEMEGHWSSSLPLPAGWSQSISARKWRTALINLICEAYAGAKLPMIKDPRFCKLIVGLEPWLESTLIDATFIIPIRHPLEVSNSLLQAEGTDLYSSLRLWITSIFMAEHATRGYRRKFISFDVLLQEPSHVLETCLQLVESTSDPEVVGSMADGQHEARPDALHQAVAFIDKSLHRQRPFIDEPGRVETTTSCNTRLIHLAEATYQAILANIADDHGISKALDQLWPRIFRLSV